ncbi:MAG: hypothetical protein MRY83_07695 [Flavobacteriales bacterium]|nr:hypothetical protein [Flavobacteriales bacterium]
MFVVVKIALRFVTTYPINGKINTFVWKNQMFSLHEIIGYAASIFVAVSLSMSNMRKLRWLNLIGAATFVIYALVSPQKLYPVAIVNAYIAFMNIYYLFIKKGTDS